MKIVGIGVDLVHNKRIRNSIKNKNFIKRTFKVKNYDCFLSISDESDFSTAFAIIQSK